MKREEILRRLEERLARGEISEGTYREIKARYEAMPEEPEEPEDLPELEGEEVRSEDIERLVDETVEGVLEQVGRKLEAVLDSGDFEKRMEDVGQRVREAFTQLGPRVEAGGRRIVISGSGVVSSDTPIDEFKCSGSGKVTSDLLAKNVRISGACKIDGGCECEEFDSSGSVKVGSDVRAREFRSSGSLKLASDLRAQEVETSGALVVAGDILDAQQVTVSGRLDVEGSVQTQEFTSSGRFRIGKTLEAQEVDIQLAGTSRIPAIKAQEISVRKGKRNGDLVADTIEGQQIYLEATRAQLVRGREVRIGPFCTIGTAEADKLEVHETSTVKEQRRPLEGESDSE